MPARSDIQSLLDATLRVRIDWSDGYRRQLSIAVRMYRRFCRSQGLPEKLSVDAIRDWMRSMRDAGRSERTVNNKRASLVTIWGEAYDHRPRLIQCPPPRERELRKLKEPRRRPTAWTPEQFVRLLRTCRSARTRMGWGPSHWEAWVLVAYESSLRFSTMRSLRLCDLDAETGLLSGPAEEQKQLVETANRLSEETVDLLLALKRPAGDDRLFPIPCCEKTFRDWYTDDVLIPAGMPHSRRDKFHKLRRTSYTRVYAKFGLRAAMKHAGHATDMSRYYLDETQLGDPDPLDALRIPRAS